MNERSSPSILLEIQRIDLRIEELILIRKNLPERNEIKQLNDRIEKLKEELKNLNQEKHSLELSQKRINDEISILTTKIEKEEEKLYSGRITNPKELEGVNKEVISLKLKMDGKETEILELMEELDVSSDKIKIREEKLSKSLSEIKITESNLTQKEKEIDQETFELSDRKVILKDDLDLEVLREYELLRKEKGGRVVAVLEKSVCNCCNMQLPSIKVDSMRDPTIFYHCDYCERILVLPQENKKIKLIKSKKNHNL